MKKLALAVLCSALSLSASAQALRIGATKDQVEKALGAKLEEELFSSFSNTFRLTDFKRIRSELPEPLRSYEAAQVNYSFGKDGKLWRVHVNVELPADAAFDAFEKTSDVLAKKYQTAPLKKGIHETLPVIEECRDYKMRGAPVDITYKKKWELFTQAQRQALTMTCGSQVPFIVDQHVNKTYVAEVVSFERVGVFFAGGSEKLVAEFLAKPVRASLVYRLVQTNKAAPDFIEAESAHVGQ